MLGKMREEPIEIMASELPSERLSDLFVALLKSEEIFTQSTEVGEVVWSENLTRNYREVDLYLVEPRGVGGKVDKLQIGPLSLKPVHRSLTPMRRAIVHDPEHPIGGGVGFLSHHLPDQPSEGFDAILGLTAPEEPRSMDIEGGQIGQRPFTLVFMLYAQGAAICPAGQSRVAAATSLDGSLLVGGDHILLRSERLALPSAFVEIQYSPGFLGEIRVPGEDPRAVVEGTDGLLREPPPDGGSRDRRDDAPLDRLPSHLLRAPAAQRNPASGRKLTGQRFHLHPRFGGKRGVVCRSGVCLPVHPTPPRKSACATYTPFGEWCPAGQRFPCWRFPRRPTARSWRAPPPSRERCELRLASAGWRAHLW